MECGRAFICYTTLRPISSPCPHNLAIDLDQTLPIATKAPTPLSKLASVLPWTGVVRAEHFEVGQQIEQIYQWWTKEVMQSLATLPLRHRVSLSLTTHGNMTAYVSKPTPHYTQRNRMQQHGLQVPGANTLSPADVDKICDQLNRHCLVKENGHRLTPQLLVNTQRTATLRMDKHDQVAGSIDLENDRYSTSEGCLNTCTLAL